MPALERTAESTLDRVASDLAHQAFPEQAAALRARCDRILKHWRRLSLKAMPHLDALTLEEFEDTIGIILSAAAAAIQSADPRQLRGVIESGPQHGIDRFVQKYSLLDLFEEVRILRGVVILELAEEMRRPLGVGEAATFHAIFDIIIQQGVMALVQRQDEERQQTQDTMRQMNERLLVSAARQHELIEQAEKGEAALRESEDRYRTLFEAMDEGYCIIEVLFDAQRQPVDYRFIEVNGSFERQAGMHDVVGKRMLEFVPDIEPHWLRNYGRVALTGEGIRFSGEYKGLNRYFDVYAFRPPKAGWPEHYIAVLFADVTQRKHAEQRKHRQNEAFQSAISGATLEESLAILARIVTDADPQARFGFHIADPEGACLHPIRVAGGMPDSYMDAVDKLPIGEDSLGCGIALATGDAVITPDVFEDAVWKKKGLLDLAKVHGCRACWSFPIATPDTLPVGTFYRYFAEPREPTPGDLAATDMVTQAAAIIISRHSQAQQRAQAEAALRESEEAHRFSQTAARAGAWAWDRDSARVTWSQECYDLFGIDPSTPLLYESWRNTLHPDDRERADQAARQAMERGENLHVEYRINHPQRGERWLNSIGRMVDPVKRPGYMAGLSQDITERKHAEQATARLAAIVTSSDDAIISKDLSGVVATWNRGAQQLFGYTAEEMIGKPIALLIPEDHLDEEPQILERIGRGESIEHYETVRRRKDGTLLNISLTVSPIRDAAGRVIGASKIARDITERVAMENRIKEQAEALAGESRRKDEFLAMLSHELRNPLAPIRSALHLMHLQERPGAENLLQKQAREIIERQVGNLTKLVRDLLDVSRVASGHVRLERQTIDLNQVVQQAIETVAPMIEQRKHKLLRYLSPEPIWCDADPTRMEEVFINLLGNAAKYTPDGGRIEVWCERQRGANDAQVRVRDDGVGIDAELLPRIFDLFTQADRSLSRSAGGLGIGLSLAHRLMALHGGSIEAHSPPQGRSAGSEFIVRLALTAEPQRPVAPAPASPDPPKPEGVRVLVVDDNFDSAMVLAALLRQWGYSVQTAYTGPEGLKSAIQWRPDVVLLDIGLPGLDGYEVARRLRSDPTMAGLPIKLIALTGYGRDTDIARAHEAGFNAHLVKPCDLDHLQELMMVSHEPAKPNGPE